MAENWVGHWQGQWFGERQSLGPGFISGYAAVRLSASGTASSGAATPGLLSGSASVTISGQAVIRDANALPPGPDLAQGAGAVSDEGGKGYVWKDHTWVKARKVVRIGVSAHYGARPHSSAQASSTARVMRAKSSGGTAVVGASRYSGTKSVLLELPKRSPCANSCSKSVATSLIVSRYNGTQLTMGMDEILALLEMM